MPLAIVKSSAPETGLRVRPEPVERYRRLFGGVTPVEVASVLQDLSRGYPERFCDLLTHIVKFDPKVAGLLKLRLELSGVPYDVVPGEAKKGEEQLAADGAAFIREGLEREHRLAQITNTTLYAIFPGYSVHEVEYLRGDDRWYWQRHWIHQRRFAFSDLSREGMILYDAGKSRMPLPPGKFVVHTPQPIAEYPPDCGEGLEVVWLWLAKTWDWKFWLMANERYGSPKPVGKTPVGSRPEVRDKLLLILEEWSNDTATVLEEGTEIDVKEPAAQLSAEIFDKQIGAIDREMSTGLVGYDIWDLGSTGKQEMAARALRARQKADAERMADVEAEELFAHALKFNAHLFGGRVPPTPRRRWRVGEELRPIPQSLIDVGGVTLDELRTASGLPPLGPERGGNEFVQTQRPLMTGSGAPAGQPSQPAQASQPGQPNLHVDKLPGF